jgi:adenylylsulfate kinase-like enzyme
LLFVLFENGKYRESENLEKTVLWLPGFSGAGDSLSASIFRLPLIDAQTSSETRK